MGRCERNEVRPTIEVATKIDQALEASLDFLVGNTDMEVDKALLDKIFVIQKLPEKDREHIIFTLDAMLRDAKARLAYHEKKP